MSLKKIYELIEKDDRNGIEKLCSRDPGLWNIVAYEREWRKNPLAMNFLSKKSPNYWVKLLEKEIYLDVISPFLKKRNQLVLDAGGGIGRFAAELTEIGDVYLLDACRSAVEIAKKNFKRVNIYWGDIQELPFPENFFDLSFAIEVVCYCTSPKKAIEEIVRVTKRNGLVILSVEGKYGSMIADENIRMEHLQKVNESNRLRIPGNMFVQYFTEEELREILQECGMDVVDIHGTHYLPDGIFRRMVDEERLKDKKYREEIIKLEKVCREDPILGKFARAWVGVGRKK
jgi:ubiquinone/menaquinone biosynthesis C-methylase UbiE